MGSVLDSLRNLSDLASRLKSFKWMGRKQRLWSGLSSCTPMLSEHATLLSPSFALTVSFSAFKVSFSLHSQ